MLLHGIGPIVLLLCFLVIGAAAFALGRRTARGRRLRRDVEYFTGLDHLLAMVSVGLWAAVLGPPLLYALPVVFPAMMVVGAIMGMFGV